MSCADVKCSDKNISTTLRKRCCSGGRQIAPTKKTEKKPTAEEEACKDVHGVIGRLINEGGKGWKCIAEGNKEVARQTGIPNIDAPNPSAEDDEKPEDPGENPESGCPNCTPCKEGDWICGARKWFCDIQKTFLCEPGHQLQENAEQWSPMIIAGLALVLLFIVLK